MGINKKHCEDCGKSTEFYYMSRCNSCQKNWQEKQDQKIKITFSSVNEKKTNKYLIRHYYFNMGFGLQSISNLTNLSEEKVKEILGINKNKED